MPTMATISSSTGRTTGSKAQTCQDAAGHLYDCAGKAREMMAAIIDGQPVVCVPTGKSHKKRLIANCTAGPRDIEAEMVRYGWAIATNTCSRGVAVGPPLRRLGLSAVTDGCGILAGRVCGS